MVRSVRFIACYGTTIPSDTPSRPTLSIKKAYEVNASCVQAPTDVATRMVLGFA
ncbi:MAG: hypothetical protein P0111_04075 [Nitrospira sp.]|nr:hypothetical protein [Nitrospira sp.]